MNIKTKFTLCAIALVSSQNLFAHTTLQVSSVTEGGSTYTSNYNNLVIGHGCKNGVKDTPNSPIVANTYIWPEFATASVYVSGSLTPAEIAPTDLINQPKITVMPGTNVFAKNGINWGSNTNFTSPVGAYAWQGNLPGSSAKGFVPLSVGQTHIVPASCAKSVTIEVDVLDVCNITTFKAASEKTVDVWASQVGSKWEAKTPTDHLGDAATYKVNRDLPNNPLAPACGAGIDYTIKASAEQIDSQLNIPKVYPKK
jgi:hypothetical protein